MAFRSGHRRSIPGFVLGFTVIVLWTAGSGPVYAQNANTDNEGGLEPEPVVLSPQQMDDLRASARAAEAARNNEAARARRARLQRRATAARRAAARRRARVRASARGQRRPPAAASETRTLQSGVPPTGETRFLDNEVIVRYRRGASQRQLNRLVADIGLRHIAARTFAIAGMTVHRYRITGPAPVRTVIARLEADPNVVSAQPNYLYTLQQTAAAAPPAMQYSLIKLEIGNAHSTTRGGAVPVAVIDSGIDRDHPELSGVVIETIDVTGVPRQGTDGHGTAVAGVIGAHGTLQGIAPDARLIDIRAFAADSEGGNARSTSWMIADAIDRAHAAGARVLNMSFAGPNDPLAKASVGGAQRRGLITIAAAGNEGPDAQPVFPGAYDGVIAVTAIDRDDIAYARANQGDYIALAAPGVDILAPAPGGGYEISSGTSLAAAHVTGLAALVLARKPALNGEEIRAVLDRSARDLGEPGRDRIYGSGLPNAGAAVAEAGS